MRQIVVILLVGLAVVAVGASIWVLFPKTEEQISDTLYDAVPLDAGLIVDIRNYGELCLGLRENDLWNALCDIASVGELNREMMMLDSLMQPHEEVAPFRGNMLFSFHPVGKDEMQSIGYVRMGSEKEARLLTDLLTKVLRTKAAVSQRPYEQTNITEVVFNDPKEEGFNNFSCAYRGGIFVFSHSSLLLEGAIRQIAADSNITAQGKLGELMRSAGKNATANLYINYSRLPGTALTVFDARNRSLIEPLGRFADWTELDVNVKPDLLLLNGFTECRSGENQWFDVLTSQPAIATTLVDAMPSATYAFFWMGIRRLQQYFTDYGRYLDQNRETAYKKELTRLKTSFGIDLQKDFAEQFEGEAALVYANVGQASPEDAPFALFRIKSASSAAEMIRGWQTATTKGRNDEADRQPLVFDHQLSFTSYRLSFDMPAALFGDLFAGKKQWCVVADNYLVFGSSPAHLQKYLRYTALRASLQTEPGYSKLTNLFSTRSNLMFYCKPSVSGELFENVLRDAPYKEIRAATGTLSQVSALVYQLNNTSGKLYNNLFLKHSSPDALPADMETQTAWESLLDTAVLFKPQLVQNHSSGETEIFVQDMAGQAYLLNNAGRILWKVKLPEPIISPVYQIDIYRNGKLQMLFNTKNHLYVIDRLGNFVDHFPIALQSPAVGGLALFDYDNNRKYRMMVACEDRKIYAYEANGKPLAGWSFKQSEHPVQTDLYHFRVGSKDFIVFADKYRVYILDRQGRPRITPEHNLPVGLHTSIALDGQHSRLALADTAGTVHFISLTDGSIARQTIKPYPSSHFFSFEDVDGDGKGDFIFAAGTRLEVFGQDSQSVIRIETEEPITLRPYIYEFATSDLRIGIVQPQNNHIWLYDSRGKAGKGFPLKGSTLFSIGRLNKSSSSFNLFVGSKNNFLYNYSVVR